MMPTIRYACQEKQMGDLLAANGVSFVSDFTERERAELRKLLEDYMSSANTWTTAITVDLKKIRLVFDNVDHVGHLYPYV